MIELACIADGKYLRHTGVMLHSALMHTVSDRLCIHVLHGAPVSDIDRERLQELATGFGARIKLVAVEEGRVLHFPSGYFPRSVWYRILLPELMPDADKVLYLDSDIIVSSDLGPLWNTDVSRYLVGAITNPFYPFMPEYPQQKLGIEKPEDYFNSGVLLMNLKRMREENLLRRTIDFARTATGTLYPDQDALNTVCRGRWLQLHPRWNVQSTLFELPAGTLPLPAHQVREALAQPAVIHFIGPFKPWHYLCRHPKQALYFEHARLTAWGEPELEGRSLRNLILRRLPLAWIDRWFKVERLLARCRRLLSAYVGRQPAVR